jgi:IS30 family transposase
VVAYRSQTGATDLPRGAATPRLSALQRLHVPSSASSPSQQASATTACRGMERHAELARRLWIKVYFCDLHSPWQRPTNENTNGLVRQYLPK